MSNFICPTCGMTNIDCGKQGYKTDKEIELEKENKQYRSALMAIEVHTAALGGDYEDLETSLLAIDGICESVLEK